MTRYLRAVCFVLAAIAVAGIVRAVLRTPADPEIPQTDLARLVARARVVWQDYGEDIKAAVGATPAAQWHGAPTEVRLTDGEIDVRVELQGIWASYDFGIPILLRTPEGQVLQSEGYARHERGGVYTFRHPDSNNAMSTPWVELRYPPNEERRIVFDATGVWRAPNPG